MTRHALVSTREAAKLLGGIHWTTANAILEARRIAPVREWSGVRKTMRLYSRKQIERLKKRMAV